MAKIKEDYTGKRFHYLTVIRFIPPEERSGYSHSKDVRRWLCQCDCGKYIRVRSDQLKNDRIKSCGCMTAKINGDAHRTHGQKGTRIYKIWANMKDRCYNRKSKDYPRYGGRGIFVCQEWLESFQSFYEWSMENGYEDKLSIDRINNEGGYSPSNCRWTTGKKQCRNRRNTIYIKYKGEEKPLQEWCDLLGFPSYVAHQRYKRRLTGEQIFENPIRKCKRKE